MEHIRGFDLGLLYFMFTSHFLFWFFLWYNCYVQ